MEGMNAATRMPKVIIYFFDVAVCEIMESEYMAKQLLQLLFNKIRMNCQIWKNTLDNKYVQPSWPKIVIVKPIPPQMGKDHKIIMDKRRYFNRAIDKITAKFRGFTTINVDCIIPADSAMYSLNRRGCLSQTGWFHYWRQYDELFRKTEKEETPEDA